MVDIICIKALGCKIICVLAKMLIELVHNPGNMFFTHHLNEEGSEI